jgi:hypothetical protein
LPIHARTPSCPRKPVAGLSGILQRLLDLAPLVKRGDDGVVVVAVERVEHASHHLNVLRAIGLIA